MKTILFLETRLGMGGAEQMWCELIKRLDRTRFRPVVCCLYEPGVLGEELQRSGIPVHSHLASNRWDVGVFFRLSNLLRRERVDLLYTINQPMAQFWGVLCGKAAGVRALVTCIHSTGKISRAGRRLWINRLTFRWTDRILALGQMHKAYLMAEEGIEEGKIEIIPNGIDPDRFSRAGDGRLLKENLGISSNSSVVAIVAMLRPEKNHEVFLGAARRILSEIPETHFLIVGDGPERASLEMRAGDLGLAPHVHFLGLRQDVPALMNLCDVAVLSSKPVVETQSISVLEYMASAKPVVATRVGSLPELIEDGKSGYLVDPGDEEALAERILRLLRNPEKAREMGRFGREKVQTSYTVERMVQMTEALFDRLLLQGETNPCA